MNQLTHQFHKIFFHISKCLVCNVEKLLHLKITKTSVNITNLHMYIYIQIYIPILHVTKITKNKNDSINSWY